MGGSSLASAPADTSTNGTPYGFPKVAERTQAFKEACEIIHRMWTEDDPVFDGRGTTQ